MVVLMYGEKTIILAEVRPSVLLIINIYTLLRCMVTKEATVSLPQPQPFN